MGWRGIESCATTKVATEPLLMFYCRDRWFLKDGGAVDRQAEQVELEARMGRKKANKDKGGATGNAIDQTEKL